MRAKAAAIFVFALFMALAFQGSRTLWEPDEGRYTNVAHLMVELDDWLVPRLSPERPHLTKPPLTYWAVAASFKLFGPSEWAARLPNAIAFAGTAVLVLLIAARLGYTQPPAAAALWTTMLGPVLSANVVTTDTLLAAFETLAVAGFAASGAVSEPGQPRRRGLAVMWLGFALAFLTKGPPGLLPLLAILVWTAWRRPRILGRLFDPAGLAIFVVVGLGWYLWLISQDPQLLRYFLVHETLQRVASGEFERNPGPFGWAKAYGPALLLGTLPWLLAVPLLRRGAPAAGAHEESLRFVALWILLPLAVLVASRSRLPLYVLPSLAPIALWLSAQLPDIRSRPWGWCIALVTAALAAVAFKGLLSNFDYALDGRRLAGELSAAVDLRDIDEVVFVDAAAWYSLRHYLGIDVEQAETEPGLLHARGFAPPEDLCEELAERSRSLILIPIERLPAADSRLAACGVPLEPIGPLRGWWLVYKRPAAP